MIGTITGDSESDRLPQQTIRKSFEMHLIQACQTERSTTRARAASAKFLTWPQSGIQLRLRPTSTTNRRLRSGSSVPCGVAGSGRAGREVALIHPASSDRSSKPSKPQGCQPTGFFGREATSSLHGKRRSVARYGVGDVGGERRGRTGSRRHSSLHPRRRESERYLQHF